MKIQPKTVEELKTYLFQMVYQWGSAGVVTNENAPAFNSVLDELTEAKYKVELGLADAKWKSNEKYRNKYMDLLDEVNIDLR